MNDFNVEDWLDLLTIVNWTWLLAALWGLVYAVRSQTNRQHQENLRRAEPINPTDTLAMIRAEVRKIISTYRLRKGRLLIAALALFTVVGVVAVVMVPPVRPQVTLFFLLTAGAMLTGCILIASVCYQIDAMDRAVEHYLDTHPLTDAVVQSVSAVSRADHVAVATDAAIAAAEAVEAARLLHDAEEGKY